MIGYKAQVINDNPIAFWTFDFDWYDSNKYLIDPNFEIKDEMGNRCPAYLFDDGLSLPYRGYQLGSTSLVSIQKSLGKSITFAPFSKVDSHPTKFPWSYIKAPHYPLFNFNRTNEFSVEFLILKKSGSNNERNVKQPIMKKGGLFNIVYLHESLLGHIECTLPNGKNLYFKKNQFLDIPHHFVLTWQSKEISANLFIETGKLYIDGTLVDEISISQWDEPTFLNTGSSLFIGGIDEAVDIIKNVNTNPLVLDQIALYDYIISENQINEHFKKIYKYEDMIKTSLCTNYWKLDEKKSFFDFTVNPIVGSDKGYLQGENLFTFRERKGPLSLQEPNSIGFSNGGGIKFIRSMNYNFIQTNDYSICFWFKLQTTKECVILSCQETIFPYAGLNIKANVSEPGKIYFRETIQSPWIESKESIYNKGNWHYLSIIRKDSIVKMYINSILQNEENYPRYTSSQNRTPLFLGIDSVGNFPSDMDVCHFTIHDFALDLMTIERHFSYAHIFKVQGITTIQGIPSRLTIRFYNQLTGELVTSTSSEENTGRYSVNLFNDDSLYIVVFNPKDKSLRRRIYGPIVPSEINDYPIKI